MDQSIINFKVYEDSVEYVGMAQATLPDLTALTQSISGAGIAGNVEAVILGHFDAMTLGLNFRTVTDQSVKLSEPRRHTIDLRSCAAGRRCRGRQGCRPRRQAYSCGHSQE